MKINRRQAMLLSAAALTTVAWAYKLWPTSTPPRRPPPPASVAAPGVPAAADSAPAPKLAPVDLSNWTGLHRAVERDPFFTGAEIAARNRPRVVAPPPPPPPAPPPAPPAPLPTYTLKMVMTAGTVRTATIGDQVVRLGDKLGEERVVEIYPDAVLLEGRGQQRRVELTTTGQTAGQIQLKRDR